MRMSDQGLAVLIHHEGYRTKAYDDGAGFMTIGVGHLIRANEKHLLTATLTYQQVMDLLRADVRSAERDVERLVTVPLTQGQFDCLTSFVFNIGGDQFGSSTLLKLLNNRQYSAVPSQLRRWTRAGGKVMNGLVSRRESEAAMWVGEYPHAGKAMV